MAVSIVATAGANNANCFVTLADAKTILGDYLSQVTSGWDAATDDEKSQALIMATRNINALRLAGDKYYHEYDEGNTDDYQPLHFPTVDDYDDDGDLYIPAAVERATAIQAAYILKHGDSLVATWELAQAGIVSTHIGRFSQTIMASRAQTQTICNDARRELSPWLITSIPISRG